MFGSRGLETETSWVGGVRKSYGTSGSARIDVLDMGAGVAYDYKFTINSPALTTRQTNHILDNGPRGLTAVIEVNP